MKRLLASAAALLLGFAAFAAEPAIRSIQIDCAIDSEGSAHITEWWDVTVTSGTEWYLVRENLGDIRIVDFSVCENGESFYNEGGWDIDRSIAEKAGRCGVNYTSKGCELCWGIGSYGDHEFQVSYTMTKAVKSLQDYDMLHLQFVSPGLSSRPQMVVVTVYSLDASLDSSNTRVWGFGYVGETRFNDGYVVAASTEPFRKDSSLILLLRLDKGVVAAPQSVMDCAFQERLDLAMEGASFSEDGDDDFWDGLTAFLFFGGWILLFILASLFANLKTKKQYLGSYRKKDIPWCREVPFDGNLAVTNFALGKVGEGGKKNSIASAMILRMVEKGAINVVKNEKGKVELAMTGENQREAAKSLGDTYEELWDMMYKASGKDRILQNKEFSNWSKYHSEDVHGWATKVEHQGKSGFRLAGWFDRSKNKPSQEGVAECRKALGLKKFLQEFTLSKERGSEEVILWQDYLVFAALFGVAERVAKELKDINPQALEEINCASDDLLIIIYMSNSLARSITLARSSYETAPSDSGGSFGGFGGGASFGGGGGFSGGGFGGGSR